MSKTTLGRLGIALLGFLTTLPLQAQEIATLALRNGERPSGELVDLSASGFTLRVNGQNRQFRTGDVAAVEFVVGPPSADAQAKINAGQPVVILRSGQVIEGRLTDIGGTRPLRLSVDTASGRRQFTSSEVAQIHVNPVARPAGTAAAPAASATPAAGVITVPANQPWTDTGITVARGQRVQFNATGDIMIASGASSGVGGSPAVTVPGGRYPVAGAPVGALIGKVGNGAPFLIGTNSQPIQMPSIGRLMLGVNDDHFADNSGSFSVSVTRLGR